MGCQWYGVKRIKSIFSKKEIVEHSLEHVFVTSSSTSFLNKTNFEPYLLVLKMRQHWTKSSATGRKLCERLLNFTQNRWLILSKRRNQPLAKVPNLRFASASNVP